MDETIEYGFPNGLVQLGRMEDAVRVGGEGVATVQTHETLTPTVVAVLVEDFTPTLGTDNVPELDQFWLEQFHTITPFIIQHIHRIVIMN
jgi:hypothetical protein